MDIGGFQKNTLIDFPRQVACLVFTRGCNFFCPYCHNPGLVSVNSGKAGTGPSFAAQDIFTFLEKRKGLIDGVAITGGEPCLQEDLVPFCKRIKQQGFKVKIDTNGSRPDVIDTLLTENLIDYIAMDIKTDQNQYHRLARQLDTGLIRKSIAMIMSGGRPYEFRTTCAAPFVTLETITRMGQMIQGADVWYLQKCSRNATMLVPAFAENPDHFHGDDKMEALRNRARAYVSTCTIR